MAEEAGTIERTAPAKSQQRGLKPWKPGQSGNPAGRQVGSRNKLGEAFIEALRDDFEQHGVAAVQKVRDEKPDQYLKVIASLMPKELTLNVGDAYSEMTDDELIDRLARLQATIAPYLAGGIGNDEDRAGEAASLRLSSPVH